MGYKSKSKMNQIVDVIHDIIKSNQDILKILSTDDEKTDVYELPDLSRKEAIETIRNKILTQPKEFEDNFQCCYMILQYGNKTYQYEKNRKFNGNTFEILILCHNDIRVNDVIGDRVLEIEQILEDLFDNKDIDKISCRSHIRHSELIASRNTNYTGRRLMINFSDFNGELC